MSGFNNHENSLSYLDVLTVFSVVLQTLGYYQDQKQASNDDILRELQKQDRNYLDKIIENQNKILEILKNNQ